MQGAHSSLTPLPPPCHAFCAESVTDVDSDAGVEAAVTTWLRSFVHPGDLFHGAWKQHAELQHTRPPSPGQGQPPRAVHFSVAMLPSTAWQLPLLCPPRAPQYFRRHDSPSCLTLPHGTHPGLCSTGVVIARSVRGWLPGAPARHAALPHGACALRPQTPVLL